MHLSFFDSSAVAAFTQHIEIVSVSLFDMFVLGVRFILLDELTENVSLSAP